MVLILFIVSRFLLVLGSISAQKIIPYLGFFPFKELLVEYYLPSWLSAFANFDGIHYLLIAKQGYSQWEQAFFPVYPLFIHFFSFIIPHPLIAALVISNGSLLIGLIFFQKLLKGWGIKTLSPIMFLLSFPTAFFFGVVYTEGLFFMFFILSLYFLHRKQYWLAGLFAALSSCTRLIGVFLIVPFFFHFIAENNKILNIYKFKIKNFKFVLFSPFLGLISYMVYLYKTTGDPLFFFNSQPIFGAHRSTHFILLPQVYYSYVKILLTAAHDFQWYLSFFEMGVFSLIFIILILDLLSILKNISKPTAHTLSLLGLNIFSFINLVLPTLTGTFSSIPRYTLFSFSLFIFLGRIQSNALKILIAILLGIVQIILFGFFIQGYFIG